MFLNVLINIHIFQIPLNASYLPFIEPGRDSSPEAKKDFIKYEFPRSTYTRVGEFSLNGLADNEVPQEIGEVAEMRIRVLGHNSENWIILSEVQSPASCLCRIFKAVILSTTSLNCLKYFITKCTRCLLKAEPNTIHWGRVGCVKCEG